jgi:hypothetical protein
MMILGRIGSKSLSPILTVALITCGYAFCTNQISSGGPRRARWRGECGWSSAYEVFFGHCPGQCPG